MKRSTSRWTTAMAAAALIALPAAGFAQTPASPQTQPQNPPTQSTASQTSQDSASSPAEHVRAAKQALSSIQTSTLPASARPKVAQLRSHLNNLEKDVAKSESPSSGAAPSAKSGKQANWGTEVAAIDKTLTELIGSDTGSSASGAAGSATGTSGSTATIDEATKNQLREVRKHITAIATSMSGTPKTEASAASSSNPSMSSAPSATPSATSPTAASPAATPTTEPSATTPTASATQQTTPASAQPPTTEPTAQQQPTAEPTAQPQAGEAPKVDRDAAKQHLSEARESLSQLAALPEAAKLQGETRNQISQLIANFNELITTQTDWKASYAKVESTLNTLLGAEAGSANPSAPAATGTTGTAATPAPAGTSGANAVTLEQPVRTKLEEFRTHMKEFEQAAGGVPSASNAPAAASPSVATGATSSPAAQAAAPSATSPTPTNPTSTASPTPTEPSAPQSTPSATPSATPNPTPSAGVAGATGTSGSMNPSATDAGASNSEAETHLNAISDILSKAKNGKLDKDQTEQIKMHVDQLKQIMNKK